MNRLLAATFVAALALAGGTSVAGAANQPSQGVHSTGRDDAGFGGGPHCHVLTTSHGPFSTVVYPSHTGHAHAGGEVFTADPDCNGIPGLQT